MWKRRAEQETHRHKPLHKKPKHMVFAHTAAGNMPLCSPYLALNEKVISKNCVSITMRTNIICTECLRVYNEHKDSIHRHNKLVIGPS